MNNPVVAENATTPNRPEIPDGSPEPVSSRYKLARDLVPGDVIDFGWQRRTVAGTTCAIRNAGMHPGTGYAHGLILIGWEDHPTAEYGAAPDHQFTIGAS